MYNNSKYKNSNINSNNRKESCADLYPRTKKLAYEISFTLNELESNYGSMDDGHRRVTGDLVRLYDHLQRLDTAIKQELKNKELWKRRIVDLWEQYNSYTYSLQKLQNKWNRLAQEHNERQQLFDYQEALRNRDATGNLLDANEALKQSIGMIDEMNAHSSDVMSTLKGQGDRFKRLKTGVMNMMHTLGLSNSVIRVIQHRECSDRFLIIGCMIFTLFFFWFCLHIFSH
jgi:hypothetical protein